MEEEEQNQQEEQEKRDQEQYVGQLRRANVWKNTMAKKGGANAAKTIAEAQSAVKTWKTGAAIVGCFGSCSTWIGLLVLLVVVIIILDESQQALATALQMLCLSTRICF